jgi:hypothetical protein
MYFSSIFVSVLHMIFFNRIMDDGRPHMWTHFIIKNEMKTIVASPLLEGSSSSIVVAPPLLQLPIVRQCHKKIKERMMKQMLESGVANITYSKRTMVPTMKPPLKPDGQSLSIALHVVRVLSSDWLQCWLKLSRQFIDE